MKPASYTFQGIKNFRKELDTVIRIKKQQRKDTTNQRLHGFSAEQLAFADTMSPLPSESNYIKAYALKDLRDTARSYHIAISELRGHTREEIERNPETDADEKFILSIKSQITSAMEALNAEWIAKDEPV